MPTDEDCPFCAIADGRGHAHVVARDEATVAFLDRNPVVDGHLLVAPTGHYPLLTDVPTEDVGPLFRTVQAVSDALLAALDADGVTVIQSSGAAAGQDVFHAHVHVVPRYEGDPISLAPSRHTLSDEGGEAIAERLRAAL